MRPISPVLPHAPEHRETILAKDQPQYKQLPVVRLVYTGGVITTVSRYKLTWRERLQILFKGTFWIEQMTFGELLQPQRPTAFEPLTTGDLKRIEE
jgi:hypothetical protein